MNRFYNIDILCVAGAHWGMGHFARMQILLQAMEKKKFSRQAQLYFYQDRFSLLKKNNANGNRQILICDIRDLEIEETITQQYAVIIFLDYAGRQKNKKFFYLDTLPHYNMSLHAYKNSLRHFITDIPLFAAHKKSAKIILHKNQRHVRQKKNFHVMYQLPVSGGNKRLSRKNFLKLLQKKNFLVSYFGQSAFEALLLQKDVHLYPLSNYHARLSQSLARRWNNSGMNLLYLDNRGTQRLLQYIERAWKIRKQ